MRGWTARVGLRKPMKDADIAKLWTLEKLERLARWMEANGARPERPPADADWAGALLGQMRWPGDPDHVDVLAEAMNRPIDHDLINGPLDMLAERQEQRRQSLRAAKAKVDALPADQRARLEGEFQRAEQEAAAIMRHGYPRALPLPVPKREAATYELSDDARPCCHTTGPNHHPACQEAK